MPFQGRQGRRRRYGLAALIASAAASWAAAGCLDAANADIRIWACMVTIAGVTTLAALQFALILMLAGLLGGVIGAIVEAREAMTGLLRRRPDPGGATPPPWRALRSVDGGPNGHGSSRSAN